MIRKDTDKWKTGLPEAFSTFDLRLHRSRSVNGKYGLFPLINSSINILCILNG